MNRFSPFVDSRVIRSTLFVAATLLTAACHGALDVSDPTLVQDKDIANAAGANARRLNVFVRFNGAAFQLANDVAIFTDERTIDQPANYYVPPEMYLDRRDSEGYEAQWGQGFGTDDPHLGGWDDIFTKASIAIPAVRAYTPDSLRGDYLAQLYAMRAYAIVQIAEDVCPGFPINDIVNNVPVYSPPFTTDSALGFAMTQIDSVFAEVHDSTRYTNFAKVLKGRVLLDLGKYAEAAAAVADVPASFTYTAEVGADLGNNYFATQFYHWDMNSGGGPNEQFAVGNHEGGNGLPFVSANDPRIGAVFFQTRYTNSADSLYDETKYTLNDPMIIGSGLEAQLIQAEAALNAGDVTGWLNILNTLRAAATPAMAPLTDPGTTAARVDLLYSERAFWLYLTGHRLGDLRRLIRNYGRDPESVFPTGQYPMRGLRYGTATAIPFIQSSEARYNPLIKTGCTTR